MHVLPEKVRELQSHLMNFKKVLEIALFCMCEQKIVAYIVIILYNINITELDIALPSPTKSGGVKISFYHLLGSGFII